MIVVSIVFFFKQKTAYEMRISDWSSDVCSSDLAADDDGSVCWRIIMRTTRNIARNGLIGAIAIGLAATMGSAAYAASDRTEDPTTEAPHMDVQQATDGKIEYCVRDRKRVVEGTGVSVRVALGGRRYINKKKNE